METCPLDVLPSLLSDKTRVVALPHVSNLLGGESSMVGDQPALWMR